MTRPVLAVKVEEVCATCHERFGVWQVPNQKRDMGRGITLSYVCIRCSRG